MIISDAAIRNRTTVGVIVVMIITFGVYSYMTLPREAAPDIPIPFVIITTPYEGVAPEDVESSVTNKIEQKLTGLSGVKEIRSTSSEGQSVIMLEFHPDVKIDDALQRVRDKIDLARPELPDDIDEPTLKEVNFAEFPIMTISVSGPISPVQLKKIAEDLEDRIETVPGVLEAQVLGGLEREIRIEFDVDRVNAYGLGLDELARLLPSENVNVSSGSIDTPQVEFTVRVPGEFDRPKDIEHLLLTERNGRPIYLLDVATIRDTFEDRLSLTRTNGVESVTLSVKKRVGANIIRITDHVRAILTEARKQLPPAVKLDVTLDQSKDIRLMVADLENNILSGLILVVAVLFIFLGWRTSLIVALAIPLSMLLSFSILTAIGMTLNMVVLFSLVLALGMLVDNAIVIVENIYRHRHEGYGALEAARRGAGEVAWPVITSTLTTVAAFSPMLFWPGIMGEFMKYLPATLIITLLSSLFVALVISPTVGAWLIKVKKGHTTGTVTSHPFQQAYRRFLELALTRRLTTLTLAGLLLVGLAVFYGRFGTGVELFPETDPRRAFVDFRGPQGTSLARTDAMARAIEGRLQPYADEIRYRTVTVGAEDGGAQMFGQGGPTGKHAGRITLEFLDFEDRPRPAAEVVRCIRGDLTDIAGFEIEVDKQKEGPPVGKPVTIEITGDDFKVLEQLSETIRRKIIDVPGLVNLRDDYEAARPELRFVVDRRRAILLGVSTRYIGQFLRTAVFGSEVSQYRQFEDEYDITIRLPLRERQRVDSLLRLRVPDAGGRPIPLSSLGEFRYAGGLGNITHIDRERVITLTGDNEGRLGPDVLADVQKRLAGLELPAGYQIRFTGETEEQDKASAFLSKAFIAALLLITLILVAQFNSLSVPVIILSTVVLSMIGVFAGLLITGLPFGILMTGIGVISLAGVVVNNAIVLLDYTRQLRDGGLELVPAAVQAGLTRLRPVMLTATTTILGLIPMATGVSFDFRSMRLDVGSETAEWWGPMAVAVIFGLAFATVLTLVVAPTLYCSLQSLKGRVIGTGLSGADVDNDE